MNATADENLPLAIEGRTPELLAEFEAAIQRRGPDYKPNTHLLHADGSAKYTNRLILEASPYLLQHAHNPVDWYPWGDAAFERAERENKLIFLSVGYATCHWCHVMEEESFDTERVAEVLNAHFVPIKVDRETRPDIDHTYMLATQIMTNHGGWPNSVFLLADGRPFYAGTYFPPDRFLEILNQIAKLNAVAEHRTSIEAQAKTLSESVQRVVNHRVASQPLDDSVFSNLLIEYRRIHNDFFGGFSQTQQFPHESDLLFLLDRWRRTGVKAALDTATHTLRAIAAGGLHDHVGGGFHRYTVDVNWRTPHFEKMLYNQALLSRVFLEAYSATGDATFRRATERTFEYVRRDLTVASGPARGSFYAAEDADSIAPNGDREEGYFYVWTPDTVAAKLPADRAQQAIELLNLNADPTVEGQAVAHLEPDQVVDFEVLDPILEMLRQVREERPRPRRDDKVIVSWNGMMIRALADGGLRLGVDGYTQMAQQAADAIWATLHKPDGGLHRFYAEGRAEGNGQLSDYSALGLGLVALHDATGEERWLERAELLAAEIEARFRDEAGWLKQSETPGPLGAVYESGETAIPSGISMALELFARLALRSENPEFQFQAETLLDALSGNFATRPQEWSAGLTAAAIMQNGESEVARSVGRGHARVVARLAGNVATVRLALDPTWHVNSDQPEHPDLIPTLLELNDGTAQPTVRYPSSVTRELGFMDQPLSLFEGTVEFEAEWPQAPKSPVALQLTVQPCSDRICLAPETHTFRLR